MDYYEKRSVLSLGVTSIVYASVYYDIYDYLVIRSLDPSNLNFWGNIFLELFLCLVAVYFMLYAVFNYVHKRRTGEAKPKFTDERDDLIELRAVQVSFYMLALGVFLSLVAAIHVSTLSPVLIGVMSAFFAAGIAADSMRILGYRKSR